jgi:hypothetical protein
MRATPTITLGAPIAVTNVNSTPLAYPSANGYTFQLVNAAAGRAYWYGFNYANARM